MLALESSADDTCAAVLDDEKVLANVVVKQHAMCVLNPLYWKRC